jgi:hypothetical protein
MSQRSPVRLVKKDERTQHSCDNISPVEEAIAVCENMRGAFLNMARQMEALKGILSRLTTESQRS